MKVSEDFIGTCQACMGEFKVGTDGLMVLHGYKRPGDGYTVGNCPGYDHKPFQHETTLTQEIVEHQRTEKAREEAFLAGLRAGTVTKLIRTWKDYNPARRDYDQKSERIGQESEHWTAVHTKAVATTEQRIRHIQMTIDFYQDALDAWVPGQKIIGIDTAPTGKMRYLRRAYDPAEAELEVQKAAEKAARAAKPGKLKLILYRPAIARFVRDETLSRTAYETAWQTWVKAKDAENAAWKAELKAWAKETFPVGKVIVRDDSEWSLPRSIRAGDDAFEVISISIDWSYLDEIETMLPDATRFSVENKQRSFTIARAREA